MKTTEKSQQDVNKGKVPTRLRRKNHKMKTRENTKNEGKVENRRWKKMKQDKDEVKVATRLRQKQDEDERKVANKKTGKAAIRR